MSGREALARVLPTPVAALEHVETVAGESIDAASLDLIHDRVGSLLGGPSQHDEWRSSDGHSAADRALMAFVEQFVFSVSSLGDDEVDALLEHWSPEQVHEISNVVWLVDLTARLELVASEVLG